MMSIGQPNWAISSGSQHFAEGLMGALTVVALLFCVWMALRERKVWPVMVWIGAWLISTYEPINNLFGHCAYANIHQDTAFTLFGRHMPWYLVLIYPFYFGIVVPLLVKQFEQGVTARRALTYYGLLCLGAAIWEPLFIGANWWHYYGANQPLMVAHFPMWWWFADATAVYGTAVFFHLLRRHVFRTEWHSWFFIPGGLIACTAIHLTAAFPVYAALDGTENKTLTVIASLVTIALSILYSATMARVVAVPELASAGERAPAWRGALGGAPARRVAA